MYSNAQEANEYLLATKDNHIGDIKTEDSSQQVDNNNNDDDNDDTTLAAQSWRELSKADKHGELLSNNSSAV